MGDLEEFPEHMSSTVTLPHLPFRGPWCLEPRAPSWILPFLPVGRNPVGLLVGKEMGEGEELPHFPSQVIREMERNVDLQAQRERHTRRERQKYMERHTQRYAN